MSRTYSMLWSVALASAAACLSIAAVHAKPVPVGLDDFVVRCALLDPVTRQEKTEALPGDQMLLKVTVKVGANIFSKPVNIVAAARVKVFGFALESRIGAAKLMIPGVAEREELQQVYGNGEPLPSEYGEQVVQLFDVPQDFPRSVATVEVTAQIPDVGERTCSKALRIL